MTHILYISEQHQNKLITNIPSDFLSLLIEPSYNKRYFHNPEMSCFHVYGTHEDLRVDTNYFVGVDWLVPGNAAIYVEPKLNNLKQVDYLGMLLNSLAAPENLEHLDDLFHVQYDSPWIEIPTQKDRLSPFLIAQFLRLVQRIVRKGLKKSYYRIKSNLNSRIKGKILVGQQTKTNVVRNRLTKTMCNFQEYGVNTIENQFIKLVLGFVSSYLYQKEPFFSTAQKEQMKQILSYCLPSFEYVESMELTHEKIHVRTNVFYKEYEEAIKIGTYLLKRFSFNLNKSSQIQTSTPPFWIDMSKLFELYIFGKLRKILPDRGMVTYHDNFRGRKQTDILIRSGEYKCVIDCKYKPQYADHDPSLVDKRQLAGYVRLKSIYDKLDIPYTQIIKGLVVYSHQECDNEISLESLFSTSINEYVELYKLGVGLPQIPS